METKFICPYCNSALLITVSADPPWTTEHLACPVCDSTFEFGISHEKEDKDD